MEQIQVWLAEFGQTVVFVVQYLIGILYDIVQLIVALVCAFLAIPVFIGAFFPPAVLTIATVVLVVAVVFKVIGREG